MCMNVYMCMRVCVCGMLYVRYVVRGLPFASYICLLLGLMAFREEGVTDPSFACILALSDHLEQLKSLARFYDILVKHG